MRTSINYLIPPFALLIISTGLNAMPGNSEQESVQKNLAFECHREADLLPPVSKDVDGLYKYALFIQQKDGPKDFNEVARYYRIAAAHGHYKAATNLQSLISRGLAVSANGQKETIDLVEKFMSLGVPGAFYDMGHYLEIGYGVQQDNEKANAYFRKAADMGNPDAQYHVAELLGRIVGPKDVMVQMQRCATYQGHALAAQELAAFIREGDDFEEAVKIYHEGTKSGDSTSARRLSKAFEGPPASDELYYLDVNADKERARRYKIISEFLDKNEQLGPKVPDLDSIVPLPPAKLPVWDGTFQWQKERDNRTAPQKPSNALINELSEEKQLDPATGLPLRKN